MTGLTLRYTWITLAMFTGTHPPLRGAVTKNVYISLGSGPNWSMTKTQKSVVYYLQKKVIAMQQRNPGEAVTVSPSLKKPVRLCTMVIQHMAREVPV
jgi:hypothetical protein